MSTKLEVSSRDHTMIEGTQPNFQWKLSNSDKITQQKMLKVTQKGQKLFK